MYSDGVVHGVALKHLINFLLLINSHLLVHGSERLSCAGRQRFNFQQAKTRSEIYLLWVHGVVCCPAPTVPSKEACLSPWLLTERQNT